jgi:hypothetical protein
MSKVYKTFTEVNDDEEEIEPLKIKDEGDIIYYYTNVQSETDMDLVYEAVLDFEIERKIDDYRESIYQIYKNAFEVFLYDEVPTHIFDTGLLNNSMVNFINCIYYSSNKGKDLEIVLKIYHKYLKSKQGSNLW